MTRLSEDRVFLLSGTTFPDFVSHNQKDPVSGARKAGTGPQGAVHGVDVS